MPEGAVAHKGRQNQDNSLLSFFLERDNRLLYADGMHNDAVSGNGVHHSWWHEERKVDDVWWASLPLEGALDIGVGEPLEARTCTCGSSLYRRLPADTLAVFVVGSPWVLFGDCDAPPVQLAMARSSAPEGVYGRDWHAVRARGWTAAEMMVSLHCSGQHVPGGLLTEEEAMGLWR